MSSFVSNLASSFSNLSSLNNQDRIREAVEYTAGRLEKTVDFMEISEFSPIGAPTGSLMFAGVGALAAGLFAGVSPLGGAIFGVAGFLAGYTAKQFNIFGRAVDWICEKVNCDPESMVAKVVKVAAPIITGILAGLALTLATGFSLGAGSVAGLLLGSAIVLTVVVGSSTLVTFTYGLYDSIKDRLEYLDRKKSNPS